MGSTTLYTAMPGGSDPYMNLALEEAVLEAMPDHAVALLLYVNAPSVIIGKHQNPWREANLRGLSAASVPLVRRISGGGTVYHDFGNLNFSFITSRAGFGREANLSCVIDALAALGVRARMSGTFDLYVAGSKISGNSFCFRRTKAVHHGTLLVSADSQAMRHLLAGAPDLIETHAVQSRPAHTINLAEVDPLLTVDAVREAVLDAAHERYGVQRSTPVEELGIDESAVESLYQRNRSWEWVYGRTPSFRARLPYRSCGAERTVLFEVEHGRITAVAGTHEAAPAGPVLAGVPFEGRAVLGALTAGGVVVDPGLRESLDAAYF